MLVMMRVISLNINGIRAGARKGFFEWLAKQKADVVCLQETKAKREQLSDPIFQPKGYHAFFHDAQKPGYSGTAIYTKHEPDKVHYGLGWPVADDEGRYVQIDIGNLSVGSLYMPSGSSGDLRQHVKFEFMDQYEPHLLAQKRKRREHIICGDWNIVHKEIDIKNFKPNQKNSGCLPEERAWLDKLFVKHGFVDAFRAVDQRPHQYTWWSNRGRAYENNVGWRIDYQITTPGLADKIKKASVFKEIKFSDHAPLIIDYNI